MKRLIIFLIRKRFGLKKYQTFQFSNQKEPDTLYYFGEGKIMKLTKTNLRPSNVSLNWLLDDECEIILKGGI